MPKTRKELLEYLDSHYDIGEEKDTIVCDTQNIIYLLENCEISIGDANTYFVRVNCESIIQGTIWKRLSKVRETPNTKLSAGINSLAFTGDVDFGHTSTDWYAVMKLGIYGLRERCAEYLERYSDNPKRRRFYSSCVQVYDAAFGFLRRCADIAEKCNKTDIANGLINLCTRAPENMFEAMQTILIYYTLQHFFDGTNLRTLGRLDSLLYPFYVKEDKTLARGMIEKFYDEIESYKATANIPFALGGSDVDGKNLFNELSYELLDAYRVGNSSDIKLHLLCTKDTPEAILDLAMTALREGRNSIVFMSDDKVIESLVKLGDDKEDAVDYHVVGCYECGARNELTCSCNARVNLPKALEVALNGGCDMINGKEIGLVCNREFQDFESLLREFKRQTLYFVRQAMEATDISERYNHKMHSSPILSSTYTSALESGGDIYCDCAAKYCNSSINALGLATAVDSLAAIRKLVYEDKTMTLGEFVDILKNDWQDNEVLRLKIKNRFPKYGVGDEKTDKLAAYILDILGKAVNGRPNEKGGVYRLGTFSIDWRWQFGNKTAASADGRHSGEPISQNTGATFGADKKGASAHLISAAYIDMSNTPNGSIVDIDLHSSAVSGENGLIAMKSTLKTYFDLGGFAVHYNVLDTKTLEEARKDPDKYPNLQVRLCGWNVLFSSLSDREKDEFISRSRENAQ